MRVLYNMYCRLISTNGYVVVDDTNSPRFTSDAWPWVMNRNVGPPDQQKCKVDPYQRIDCGYVGISQFDCEGKVATVHVMGCVPIPQ